MRFRSTGTTDYKKAEIFKAEFILERGKIDAQKQAPILTIREMKLFYFARYLKKEEKVSKNIQLTNLKHWEDHFGFDRPLASLSTEDQEAFITHVSERYKPGTVKRIFGTGTAAIRRVKELKLVSSIPDLINTKHIKGAKRETTFEPEQFAAFWQAIDDEYLARYVMLGMNTAGRPNVLYCLKLSQIDRKHGLINLQPPDRDPTDKGNAVVKITKTLEPWLDIDAERDGLVIGRQQKYLYRAWKYARTRAGLGSEFIPYVMRHTVATIMDEA